MRLSERLVKTNQTGKVLFKNRDGVIEFEISNSRDLSLILNYICSGYILLFAVILVIVSRRKESGNNAHNSLGINYYSIYLVDMDKEILFVDNIKQAVSIVKYKIN